MSPILQLSTPNVSADQAEKVCNSMGMSLPVLSNSSDMTALSEAFRLYIGQSGVIVGNNIR
jgi:hypothetical protein